MVRINISLLATLSASLLPLTSAMPTAGKPPSIDSLWPILKERQPRPNPNTRLHNRVALGDLESCASTNACDVFFKAQAYCDEKSNAAGSTMTWMECMCTVEKTEYTQMWDDIEYCVTCVQAADPSYDVATLFGIEGDFSTGVRAECDRIGISSSDSSSSTETDSDTDTDADTDSDADADADADTDTDTDNGKVDSKTTTTKTDSTKKNGGNNLVISGYGLIPVMVGALSFAL